jgi:glycosyltransferase involved in cell wall biosynthesis
MSSEHRLRVAAVSAQGPDAPAFRVRTKVPAPELARHGVDVVGFPLFSPRLDELFHRGPALQRGRSLVAARRGLRRRMRDRLDSCETTLVQRQVDILPSRSLERLAIGDRRLVLDVDDAVWLDAASQAGGHPLAFLKGTRGKIRWLAAQAEHVIAGNDYLAEWLSDANPRVTVVPSLVAVERVALRRHADSAPVTLGWIGSSSTARYLAGLRPALERVSAARPEIDWELWALGGPVPDVRGMACFSLGWSEQAERDLLARMDIGLMPLPDDPWTRGKCAYKALVYMSAGVPVVADEVGVTAAVVGHERAGLVTPNRDAWVDALVALAGDAPLRTRMGAEGRRRVEQDFSTRAWAPRLAELLGGNGA